VSLNYFQTCSELELIPTGKPIPREGNGMELGGLNSLIAGVGVSIAPKSMLGHASIQPALGMLGGDRQYPICYP
jgi:hypothetical protein